MNERLEIEGAPVAVRGTEIAAVGPASAVFLKSGKLNHVVAIDDRNRFRRALGLPLGVGTGDIDSADSLPRRGSRPESMSRPVTPVDSGSTPGR